MSGLLEGIKVIDCASFIAGPAAATVMADFGADVVKIEPPGIGDTYRNARNAPGNPACEADFPWLLDNRSKRGLALDLKCKAGREVLYRLVGQADVFVTNTPLPARARLGTRWEDLKTVNPRLVYASLTAYGEVGPQANQTGYDSTALWARSGLMDLVRPAPDSAPARSLPGMGDHPTAISLYAAIMTALWRREHTGEGAMVHTNLLANGVWWAGFHAQAMLCGAEIAPRPARENAASALHNLYHAADGRWFHLVLIPEARHWENLCRAIGQPELAADPRFAEAEARRANTPTLIAVLDAAFAAKDWEHWTAVFAEHRLTYGLIGRLSDIPEDPQMHAADVITPIDDPRAGADYIVNSPLWIDGVSKRMPTMPPAIGEHNEEILHEAGYDEGEIERLKGEGAMG